MKKTIPAISFSIADLPLFVSQRSMFALAKETGVDGVEAVLGSWSRNPKQTLTRYSKDWNVPILSLHLPLAIGKFFVSLDEAFETAHVLNAVVVAHPLKKYPLNSSTQKNYLTRLKQLGEKYRTKIMLENMSPQSSLPLYRYLSRSHPSTRSLVELQGVCEKYGFSMTFDTSHFQKTKPYEEADFQTVFPSIGNIHLSDFTPETQHLGLGKGTLAVAPFLAWLSQHHYHALITLELSPKLSVSEENYKKDIKDAVALLKSSFTS